MPTTPQETPYNKVNIVDAEGNLLSFGGGTDAATKSKQQEISDRIGNSDVTGAALPTGGSGVRGWLSAI